jgi:hypothetical protein
LPAVAENGGHAEHAVSPASEYVSCAQAAHVALDVAFRAAEAVPAGQRVQLCEPMASLNVPARHPRHSPPSRPKKPRSQRQSSTRSLALGATACRPHGVHRREPSYA